MKRDYCERFADLIESGAIDAKDVALAALDFMSSDDIEDFVRMNCWDELFEDEDTDLQDDDEFED